MAERGGNVQPHTSIKLDLGWRSKDEPSWWQTLVILLGFFLVLALWLHAPLDRKISNMEAKALDLEGELSELRSRTDTLSGRLESLDKSFSDNEWLSKEEFNKVFEDYNTRKGGKGVNVDLNDVAVLAREFFEDYNTRKGGKDVNVDLNDVAVLAREIVTKEIEKHAADGIGRADHALASVGAFVLKHSVKVIFILGIPFRVSNIVDPKSVKMITPSFGQPGECFALDGNNGFVEIKLAKAIIPQAVTLEHVDKSNGNDRSSAPKDCTVHGWFSKQKVTPNSTMYFLGNFTYDLEKSNIQTFDVTDSSRVIDTIRLDINSNHGHPSYTCIYRFRVHGYQPDFPVQGASGWMVLIFLIFLSMLFFYSWHGAF